jgi:hypothetical protein
MPLFDRVKSGAAQAVQKAQEAGKAGQAKIDEMQAARRLDALMRELGAAVYAQHAGRATDDDATIERLYSEIAAHEAEHGDDAGDSSAADDTAAPSGGPATSSSGTAGGDFKLD